MLIWFSGGRRPLARKTNTRISASSPNADPAQPARSEQRRQEHQGGQQVADPDPPRPVQVGGERQILRPEPGPVGDHREDVRRRVVHLRPGPVGRVGERGVRGGAAAAEVALRQRARSHQALSPSAQGMARTNHFSRRTAAGGRTERASTGVPPTAQAYATTSMGGLKARNDVGISAKPAIGAGTRRPSATRIAMPVMQRHRPHRDDVERVGQPGEEEAVEQAERAGRDDRRPGCGRTRRPGRRRRSRPGRRCRCRRATARSTR